MKKKGFTLVELLAVIAIIAILIILVLPNIMALFNQAKQNSFETEVKQIFKEAQQEWMKDSMIETNNIVYSRCSDHCPNELQLSGRTNIDYYVEVDKGGNVIKLFATDDTYQYEYRGKGLKIEQIGGSKQIAKLENSELLKISCNKIEIDGEDVTNIPTDTTVSYKIFWALQDNDGDSKNETLIISNSKVSGNESGSFKGNQKFTNGYDVPWYSRNISTVKVEGEVAPTSTAYWFYNTGGNGSDFNVDLSNLNVSNVTDMSYMFYGFDKGYNPSYSLVGLSNWDTSNVTNMSHMFYLSGANASTWSIGDISNWNTSNVTDMSDMFNCTGQYATTWKITIPKANGNGIDNTTSKMYGKDSSKYASAGRTFTLAS